MAISDRATSNDLNLGDADTKTSEVCLTRYVVTLLLYPQQSIIIRQATATTAVMKVMYPIVQTATSERLAQLVVWNQKITQGNLLTTVSHN